MGLEFIPIGGYSEIGRNCTALKIDDEIVILDMGLHLEKYIEHTDSDDIVDKSPKTLMDVGAIPDVRILDKEKDKVVAVCIGHAHLDHLGAAVFLANRFNCPTYGSNFTIAVLRAMLKDNKVDIRNDLINYDINSKFRVTDNIEIEFINVTHSTPETVLIAVHTKYGTVLYGNDFKLDNDPTLGQTTNFDRIKELKVKALILDCLYATTEGHTPSEKVAKEKLEEIFLHGDHTGRTIFISTFSSHIARLKTIKEVGRKIGRKVIFLGRSLAKYVYAAEDANITSFSDVTIIKYSSKARKFLYNIKNPEKYLFVVTGHQGEPKAMLSRIVNEDYFKFKSGDAVIFSCQVIPVGININNRRVLEAALKEKNVSIFRDIHVSGHIYSEDQRDFISMIKPENLIPVHGDRERMEAMKKIAIEEGIPENKIHLLKNREICKIE